MSAKAIYARVSTLDQDCAVQLAGLKELMSRSGWTDYQTYVEKGSGKEGNHRPELDRLMEDCRTRKIDTVMVWKMDRFGRSTLDTLSNIKLLDGFKTRFLCPSMNIDTDSKTPIGKFLIGIFALIAELERDFILERTTGGYRAYRKDFASGKVGHERHSKSGKDLEVGRPTRFWPRNKAIEMYQGGMAKKAIARLLKIPISSVRRALKAAATT